MTSRLRLSLAALVLTLALPAGAAFPDPDDYIATEHDFPDLLPGAGPGPGVGHELAEIHVKDGGAGGGAEAGGTGVQTSCDLVTLGCRVCTWHEGYGPLPVFIAGPGEETAVGVDLGIVKGLILQVTQEGAEDGAQEGAEGEEGGRFGPYDGVTVSVQGHCYS